MWKRILSSYFSFTKKERNGIIILLLLILIFLILPFLYPFFIKQKTYDHSQFQQAIDSLQINQQDSSPYKKYYPERNYRDDNDYAANNEASPKKKESETPGEMFAFDPNTLDENGWKKLGVKDKTIQTIQKYLSKGGKFRKPDDITKVWGLSPEKAQQLLPYIKIEQTASTDKTQAYQPYKKKEYKKEIVPIDINTADTTAFIALPGIGNRLANRIITFRNKLGGFYKIEQVGETFALPDSTFQKIKPRLIISNASVKQININTATLDELKIHPYIRYYVANAIIQYRTQHGNFSSVNDIKKVMLVTDSIYQKAAPYLKVN
jgi:competence protein ComEA